MTPREAAPALRGAIIARKFLAPIAIPLAIALSVHSATAQATCSASAASTVKIAARQWPAPLDRQITLQGDNVTLRDGLTRLASAASR
jgi:hypothetical protein